MTTASAAMTVEEFVESMAEWTSRSISRTAYHCRGNALFSREDLLQEARLTLSEVWYMYVGGWCRACLVPAPSDSCAGCGRLSVRFNSGITVPALRRVGSAAVFKHVGNLYYRARTAKRGFNAATVPLDGDPRRGDNGCREVDDVTFARSRNLAEDRLMLREAVDGLEVALGERERQALRAAMNPVEFSPGRPLLGAEKIFRRVQKTMHKLLTKDGYLDTRGYAVKPGRPKEVEMETMVKEQPARAPESPDVEHQVEQPKPKRLHHKKTFAVSPPREKAAKVKGADALSAAETRSASRQFKKGQEVTYRGGGRAGWLKAGTKLRVLGTVTCRGRTYVRCLAVNAKRNVSLQPLAIKQ